jgi:predicted MFS family arabinose efflux permease
MMLVAVPAGALADMFNRRHMAMIGLGFAILSSAGLTAMAYMGLVTPWILLGFCVLIGSGVALYGPSWQASINEQVPNDMVPAAIGLGSISYNLARSFGPAIGGVIVLAAGAKAAFAINASFYIPLWLAFFFWARAHQPSRLPPERIDRAIISGARYALHSPPIRTVMLRSLCFSLTSATYVALGPLIAKDLLHGTAATYGLMLGATGIGAVAGALGLSEMKRRMSSEALVRIFAIITGFSLLILSYSRSIPLSSFAFLLIGFSNMQTASLFNIGVQLTAPRWVTARALSLYTSAMTGGVAIGALFWGNFAGQYGLASALALSGGAAAATALLGAFFPLPREEDVDTTAAQIGNEPEVALALTMRSGPVVVDVEYDVDPDAARAFYAVAQKLQRIRHRNGGFNWSISRDIANPALWIERYHCPTWGDYLRMRDRYTLDDLEIQRAADGFNRSGEGPEKQGRRVRRYLERPFGSVRWQAETPDPKLGPVGYLGP